MGIPEATVRTFIYVWGRMHRSWGYRDPTLAEKVAPRDKKADFRTHLQRTGTLTRLVETLNTEQGFLLSSGTQRNHIEGSLQWIC